MVRDDREIDKTNDEDYTGSVWLTVTVGYCIWARSCPKGPTDVDYLIDNHVIILNKSNV
jgi:hypothetical protein